MRKIYYRSESNYDIRHTGFVGDGDSKAFNEVENVYPDKKKLWNIIVLGITKNVWLIGWGIRRQNQKAWMVVLLKRKFWNFAYGLRNWHITEFVLV